MSPSFVSYVSFLCCLLVLLLPAQHRASSHASYKLGSRQVFFKTLGKSSGNSQQASTVPPATTCSSMATGLGNNKLPIVHRQSPCSPLHRLASLTTADVLRRDASLIGHRFSSKSSSVVDAQAPSPAPIVIPTNGLSDRATRLGSLDYTVLVSYGTPEQQFPVFLDNSVGTSLLRCKPCASGSNGCDPAFDTSQSSTFAHVLCGSPECPTNCSDGSVCPYAEDILTLAPSMVVHNFRFMCMDVDEPSHDKPEVGTLDLSRNRYSLPSQLSSSWPAPATTFSYCLSRYASSHGFLALGGNVTVGHDDHILPSYAPLVNSRYPGLSSMYFIDVVGMRLGGEDLAIPAGTFGGNGTTTVDMGTTFTRLAPDAYAALRDGFRKGMSQYNNLSVPGFAGLDTCYNFTGLHDLTIPGIKFMFSNGEGLGLGSWQTLYNEATADGSFGMACLAFASLDPDCDVISAVIGTYTLLGTEVIYDVAGGKVGFLQQSC